MEEFYQRAKNLVISAGFASEIAWCEQLSIDNVEPCDVFREAAWVVINGGFRERIARKIFPSVALCFCDWNVDEAVDSRGACIMSAFAAFKNRRKIEAIANIAEILRPLTPNDIRENLRRNPIEWLTTLPHVGQITAWHLARNLGVDVAKADRHMVRMAGSYGFKCVQEFCNCISTMSGDPIRVVDIIIWRSVEIRSRMKDAPMLLAA